MLVGNIRKRRGSRLDASTTVNIRPWMLTRREECARGDIYFVTYLLHVCTFALFDEPVNIYPRRAKQKERSGFRLRRGTCVPLGETRFLESGRDGVTSSRSVFDFTIPRFADVLPSSIFPSFFHLLHHLDLIVLFGHARAHVYSPAYLHTRISYLDKCTSTDHYSSSLPLPPLSSPPCRL